MGSGAAPIVAITSARVIPSWTLENVAKHGRGRGHKRQPVATAANAISPTNAHRRRLMARSSEQVLRLDAQRLRPANPRSRRPERKLPILKKGAGERKRGRSARK